MSSHEHHPDLPSTSGHEVTPPGPPDPRNGVGGHGSASTARTVAITAVATLAFIALVGGAYLLGSSGDPSTDEVATPTPSTTTTVAPSTTEAPSTTASTTTSEALLADAPTTTGVPSDASRVPAATSPIGDVREAPSGLFCRDLSAMGYSYAAAVDYWRVHGQPNRMDADRNGIPCETVYPRSDVVSYWPNAVYDVVPSYGYPSGLLCRDILNRGGSVYDALRYYVSEGYPSRMDADGNGIPCETVYATAAEVWFSGF